MVGRPQPMARYEAEMKWGVTKEQLRETLTEMLNPMLDKLRKLAPDTRAVLLIVVERGTVYREDLGLPTHELEQVTNIGPDDLWPHIDTLTRYGIAALDDDWDRRRWVYTHTLDGWPFWGELRDFCQRTGLELSTFIIDLRFDLLD